MIGTLSGARLDRWIEHELTEGLSPRRRVRLHARLRQDPMARARYDRAVAALRVWEGDCEIACAELDLVGRWLTTEADPGRAGESAHRWWPMLAVVLTAAMVMLWAGPTRDRSTLPGGLSSVDDGWQARGAGVSGGLAMEALCDPDGPDGPDAPLVERDCGLDDLLSFAYRVSTDARGQLTLFGIDADGEPMFYLPTPGDPSGVTVNPGQWRPLTLGVRLSVNHTPGELRIYGLVAPLVATPDEVRTWAQQLASQPPAVPGDTPWIQRVDAAGLRRACPASTDCHAAELRLTLRP
jgi:hypothetical protein